MGVGEWGGWLAGMIGQAVGEGMGVGLGDGVACALKEKHVFGNDSLPVFGNAHFTIQKRKSVYVSEIHIKHYFSKAIKPQN